MFDEATELLTAICWSTPVVFFAWLACHGLYAMTWTRLWARALRATVAAAIFAVVLGAAFLFDVYRTVGDLRSHVERGVLINAAIPILALGVEAYADGARFLLDGIHGVVTRVFIVELPRGVHLFRGLLAVSFRRLEKLLSP
jgi:hypothetical protein